MARDDILVVKDADKSFGALRAVSGVSFAVRDGEIFGIAGPNGSGKSTLFNIITGIPFGPDAGEIVFCRKPLRGLGPHQIAQAGLARTFQRETAFESLTARQNVALATHFGRSGNARGDARAATEALEFCGIEPIQFDRPAGQLSMFDKKRLMIASALAMAPAMLLLDEPASGLSKPEVALTAELIMAINGRGITIVLIEHVLALLLNVSARLLVLNEGTILASGRPQDVVKDRRVIEAYLGSKGRDATGAA